LPTRLNAPVPPRCASRSVEIYYVEEGSLSVEERREYSSLRYDRDQANQRFGTQVFADGSGRVDLPLVGMLEITGRHGDLYGELAIGSGARDGPELEHRLILDGDVTMVVKVLDAEENPAAGVELRARALWDSDSSEDSGAQLGVTTAPEGLLQVRHLQARSRRWAQPPRPTRYSIEAAIPGLEQEGVVFDPRAGSTEPIVIRLPPTGRVLVKVTDRQGQAPPTGFGYTSPSLSVSPAESAFSTPVATVPAKRWTGTGRGGGVTEYPWVVTGQRYIVTTRAGGVGLEREFAGPLAQGDEVAVELHMTTDIISITGRALDGKGDPLRDTHLNQRYGLTFEGGGEGNVSGGTVNRMTDDEGRFLTYFQDRLREDPRLTRICR
jgi:hypothetical protein